MTRIVALAIVASFLALPAWPQDGGPHPLANDAFASAVPEALVDYVRVLHWDDEGMPDFRQAEGD